MDQKLRVCLISPLPPPYGGIALWTKNVLEYSAGLNTCDLFIVDTAPRWRSIFNDLHFTRIIGGSLHAIQYLYKIIKVCVVKKVRILHLTSSGSLAVLRDMLIIYVSRQFGLEVIYQLRHGRVPSLFRDNTLEWRLLCLAAKQASFVLVLDSTTAECLRACLSVDKVKMVPNCVDLSQLPVAGPAKSDHQTALFLGWVIPGKGIFELLTAWTELPPPNWTLQVAGPFKVKYQEELKQCFPSANIVYVGEVSHERAMELMAACDLFILPSHSEGFPISILEAMALSKPIIATTVGAIPEMLDNGRCGMLVPPKDVGSLTTALRDMINQKADVRALMGAHAKARVEAKYSIEVVFDQYAKIWRDI